MSFEPARLTMDGSITTRVLDPSGLVPSRRVIQVNDDWSVQVDWIVSGDAVVGLNPAACWNINIALESIGPGLEAIVGKAAEPVGAPAMTHTYSKTIDIPANFPGLGPGVYRLSVSLTLDNAGTPVPLAGFREGPAIQFYRA